MIGRNNVKVGEEQQCAIFWIARVEVWIGGRGAAAQPHADIPAIGDRLKELRLQTFTAEKFDQHFRGARLVAWWVHALGANELHQIVARLGADAL